MPVSVVLYQNEKGLASIPREGYDVREVELRRTVGKTGNERAHSFTA